MRTLGRKGPCCGRPLQSRLSARQLPKRGSQGAGAHTGAPLQKSRSVSARRGRPVWLLRPPCKRPIPPVRGKCRAKRDKRGREAPGKAGWGIPSPGNIPYVAPSSGPSGHLPPRGKVRRAESPRPTQTVLPQKFSIINYQFSIPNSFIVASSIFVRFRLTAKARSFRRPDSPHRTRGCCRWASAGPHKFLIPHS